MTNIYLTNKEFAYDNIYQKVENLGKLNENECVWTLFGALLVELDKFGYRNIVVYNDSRFVEEFNDKIDFISHYSKDIARRVHNEFKKKFLSLRVEKTDSLTLNNEISKIKIVDNA